MLDNVCTQTYTHQVTRFISKKGKGTKFLQKTLTGVLITKNAAWLQ